MLYFLSGRAPAPPAGAAATPRRRAPRGAAERTHASLSAPASRRAGAGARAEGEADRRAAGAADDDRRPPPPRRALAGPELADPRPAAGRDLGRRRAGVADGEDGQSGTRLYSGGRQRGRAARALLRGRRTIGDRARTRRAPGGRGRRGTRINGRGTPPRGAELRTARLRRGVCADARGRGGVSRRGADADQSDAGRGGGRCRGLTAAADEVDPTVRQFTAIGRTDVS
jgi:hypothetical protein